MAKFTIEVPDVQVVTMRNGASIELDYTKLSPEMIGNLLVYGGGQKVRDSASQASTIAKETGTEDVAGIALPMMEKAVAALYAGEWSQRGEGTGVDQRTLVARSIVRKAIKEKFGAKSPDWAKFTGLADKDQLAKLDETFASNEELFRPLVDEEMARREKANKEKAKAAKALTINI